MDYPANKTPTEKKKRRHHVLAALIFLLLCMVMAAVGTYLYETRVPGLYQHWEALVAKDPKPLFVSEAEYRAKNKAGYCWKDRKFYTRQELQEKAMVSFSKYLMNIADAYRNERVKTINVNDEWETLLTHGFCHSDDLNCRVWFLPVDYSNARWDKEFHFGIHPSDPSLLAVYQAKALNSAEDMVQYMKQNGNQGFTLVGRDFGQAVYGSDCCRVITAEQIQSIQHKELYGNGTAIFPYENRIPIHMDIREQGVGNFYFQTRELSTGFDKIAYQKNYRQKETYKSRFTDIYFLNNCGDMLDYPYYSYEESDLN
ncbi:hypothetical protein HMPREF9370_2465 [Neisseria wadsworthii 9715]|uniref:Uncharacterized protein n=2 Tax=Neisseria TaxID=482 RepID=G4CTQ5_9NEIS|nr:hypothetical protein HMPREF9370_2465 [Neisseria wadsworthii 9715]